MVILCDPTFTWKNHHHILKEIKQEKNSTCLISNKSLKKFKLGTYVKKVNGT